MIPPFEERGTVASHVEECTLAARGAAEQGRWDVVEDCYRRRGEYLQRASLLPQETARLRIIDQEVQERIGVAQAALTSVLQQSARIRQRLEGLRHGIGATSSDSGMILLEA